MPGMSGVFLDLVAEDQIARVVRGIEAAVLHSFEQDQAATLILHPGRISTSMTRAEMIRRTEFCMRAFRELRGDLKWSVDRILGHMPQALRAYLDGGDWRPEEARTIWRPTPSVG